MPRPRRTKAQIQLIKDAIYDFATTEGPVTVRQTFYRLVSLQLIDKSEADYAGTVSRLMVIMRESGELPWHLVEDASRFTRAPEMYDSLDQLLNETKDLYRRNIWATQPVAVEVWCEKNALASIIMQETYPLGVGLYVNIGWGSATYVHDAAVRIGRRPVPTHILYFGDHDPWGEDMSRDLHDRLTRYITPSGRLNAATTDEDKTRVLADWMTHGSAPYFTVHRIALNESHITEYDLPTRPTKVHARDGANSLARRFNGPSVELDALPPQALRDMVRDNIENYIDHTAMDIILLAEESEREVLATIAKSMTN